MSEPVLVVRARGARAARGVVVARDMALTAAPGDPDCADFDTFAARHPRQETRRTSYRPAWVA